MSGGGGGGSGSLEELRGDVVALTKIVNEQGRALELQGSTIKAQAHTIDRLTDELKVMMGKQSRLTEESEMMRVKELNALAIVESRLDGIKDSFKVEMDTSVGTIFEQLTERVHDQIAASTMDLINGRDASDRALRGEIAALKMHFDSQLAHHKHMYDHIAQAL